MLVVNVCRCLLLFINTCTSSQFPEELRFIGHCTFSRAGSFFTPHSVQCSTLLKTATTTSLSQWQLLHSQSFTVWSEPTIATCSVSYQDSSGTRRAFFFVLQFIQIFSFLYSFGHVSVIGEGNKNWNHRISFASWSRLWTIYFKL